MGDNDGVRSRSSSGGGTVQHHTDCNHTAEEMADDSSILGTLVTHLNDIPPETVLQFQFEAMILVSYLTHMNQEGGDAAGSPDMGGRLGHIDSDLFGSLFHAMCQVRCNAFGIIQMQETMGACCEREARKEAVESFEQIKVALGLFRLGSMFNHSCQANAAIRFQNRRLVVSMSETVGSGQEITHCYGPQRGEMATPARKRALKEQYFFDCRCEACASGDDSFMWFACQQDGCFGSLRPLDTRGLVCNGCGKECTDIPRLQKFENIARSHFASACRLLDHGDYENTARTLEHCLLLHERLYCKNHKSIGEVHDMIGKVYALQHQWNLAATHVRKSIAVLEKAYGSHSVQVAREQAKLAQILSNSHESDQCLDLVNKVYPVLALHESEDSVTLRSLLELRRLLSP